MKRNPQTAVCKLIRDTLATGVHGITGRDIDEGTLVAGTLIRDCLTHTPNVDGGVETTFQASTDGGVSWYKQRSFENFAGRLEQLGPLKVIHRGGQSLVVPRSKASRG